MEAASPAHLLEVSFQLHNPLADQPAVGLDLRLAGTAEKAEPTALPLQMGPGPHQPRALVVQVREFDLQRTFPSHRPLTENI